MIVLVITCDKYAHVVPTFWHFYRKNWPENPFQTLIVTTTQPIDVPAPVLCLGADKQFASNMIDLLTEHIQDPVFMFFHEDYILRWANHEGIMRAYDLIQRADVDCVRLKSMPVPATEGEFPGFGEIEKGAQWSLSHQVGFWKRDAYKSLLIPGNDPWDTEMYGSSRTVKLQGRILGAMKPVIDYGQYYTARQVNEREVLWCKENW